ncbi:MAG: hypothetical protein E6H60_08525 [Betaproteobacteria bacterium]|nr:MAG: hypothetical protein E6H60_08525 [Betaproteobacteria bacterium]
MPAISSKRARGAGKKRESFAGARHLRREGFGNPLEAAIYRFHRLVRAVIEAPLQVEGPDLMPVPLAERIRKAAVNRPSCVNADQIHAVGSIENGLDDLFARRQGRAADDPARPNVGRETEMRILRQRRDCRPQGGQKIARHRQALFSMPTTRDQM